jgi:energy-coupling factor transport system ATP-binding protein
MIRAEGLSFCYEGASHDALDNITFHIDRGEFVAILGHNGSGKSTLAKLVNALKKVLPGRYSHTISFLIGSISTTREEPVEISKETAG